jgi:hypothetical protein
MKISEKLLSASRSKQIAQAVGLGAAGVGLYAYGTKMTNVQLALFNLLLPLAFPVPTARDYHRALRPRVVPSVPAHGGDGAVPGR